MTQMLSLGKGCQCDWEGRMTVASPAGPPRPRGGLLSLVCPHQCYASVFLVDPLCLRDQGVDGLIIDVDNTLVAWDKHEPTGELLQWFEAARRAGIRCCIVSNSRRVSGVESLAKALGAGAIVPAGKPLPGAFRRAMRMLGTSPRNTAVIGDQVFTDILGGNALGLRTLLVKPVGDREFVGTRVVRRIERAVLSYLRRRGFIPGDDGAD